MHWWRGRRWRTLATVCWLAACKPEASQSRQLRQLPAPRAARPNVLNASGSRSAGLVTGAAKPRSKGSAHVAQLAARLPTSTGPRAPSLMRTGSQQSIDAAAWADVGACQACHPEQTRQWRQSAHAHASFDNPWYRFSVDRLRDETGLEASQHCGGCHDPLLLLTSKMLEPITPGDPLATAGITCLVCHSASQVGPDGNASIELSTAAVPIPTPGDPSSLARHRERLTMPALRSVGLCGACHRGFLGPETGNQHHLFGMDDVGAWGASAFAGSRADILEPIAEKTCNGCHMDVPAGEARGDAPRTSHRFLGGHTALLDQTGDAVAQRALARKLRAAVRIVAPVLWVDGEPMTIDTIDAPPDRLALLLPGAQVALDVTVRSRTVGHAFPGGLKDTQDTWLQIVVRDGTGEVLARSGMAAERHNDPNAYYLRAAVLDDSGQVEPRHLVSHFGTVAYDHTVPATGARTVRYRFRLNEAFAPPLRATIELKHRRHGEELRAAACAATRSQRGRAFAAAATRRGETVIDGCRDQPITLVARHEARFGGSAAPALVPALWSQLYDHALGLSVTVQEQLDEARKVAELALARVPADQAATDRADVMCLLGRIAARQGRVKDAEAWADGAQALVGPEPAVLRVRADANLRVWRFEKAERALRSLVAASPRDTAAHRDLARARLSLGDHRGSLDIAHRGLALQPRDEGLLRAQALALAALQRPDADEARSAFLRYRAADRDTTRKIACDRQSPTCARDRMPVVTMAATP